MIVGKSGETDTLNMLTALKKRYIPNKFILFKNNDDPQEVNKIAGSLQSKEMIDNKATAYICATGSCKNPTTDINEMFKILDGKS